MKKDFDIKEWAENNERLARECFEDFLKDYKEEIEMEENNAR